MGLPVEVNNLMMGSLGGYTIGRSLRFRKSASAYLNRTPSASSRTTWTYSTWIKRGLLTASDVIELFAARSDDQNVFRCFFDNSSYQLILRNTIANVNTGFLQTTQVFRDPSAWYHLVFVWDSSQATSTNRMKLYVNGVQVTAFATATYPALNENSWWNGAYAHNICGYPTVSTRYFDGYIAEVNFIDGQALTPSSFGAYDTNGVWQPKKYSGTYGTNGFYLPFSNTTSTTTLVQDSSGNGNNWTPNNISVTAGTTYDSMIDSPTPYADGGNGRGNYAVGNPLNLGASTTLTNANMLFTSTSAAYRTATATIAIPTGSWYFEITAGANSAGDNVVVGIQSLTENLQTNYVGSSATSYCYASSAKKYNNGSNSAYGASWTQNDVIGIAFDGSNLSFYKNGSSQGNAYTGLSGTFVFAVSAYNSSASINFGQQPFSYTPPSGFKALNTYNLPAASISNGAKHFDATLWTGDGTSPRSITNATGFQPDLVWVKMRSGAYQHGIADSVRGGNKILHSNSTAAEDVNWQYGYLSSFNSNGFTMQAGSTSIENFNLNGSTFVGWQWKAGGTGVTNTSGTITSTVSANTTAGFSVVTYTGTGANATVGHGLGVAPSMYIIKRRNTTGNWPTFHTSITASNVLYLNVTDAQSAYSNVFNATNPTSTVFNIGTSTDTNASGSTYVAYCFAAVSGYSSMGSFVGNGSADGPFIFTNFRPRWIMIKRTDAINFWLMMDTTRNTYNVMGDGLLANTSGAEFSWNPSKDILSNGFKIRTTDSAENASGGTYIYAAFAENPFKYSRGR